MYAIVDIETTGGSAATAGITEIAILLHDGQQVEKQWSSLVNPLQPIPAYITSLTGISNQTVRDAPAFPELAGHIHQLLEGRVFVAHNVNFDYSFVHHQLAMAGYDWQAGKLCTVRYARRVFPGRRTYSLGSLCADLGIHNAQRHRALGDAVATSVLLERCLHTDVGGQHLRALLKVRSAEGYAPLHLPAERLNELPYCAGVYYFKDSRGQIIYIGKARNLKYRVKSHFTNNSTSSRKQELARKVHQIDWQVCATELHALVLEEIEIKKWWPACNVSQKRPMASYGLYPVHDQRGYLRLVVEKYRRHLPALVRFFRLEEGYAAGRQVARKFGVNDSVCFLTAVAQASDLGNVQEHNERMAAAIGHMQHQPPSLLIVQQGSDAGGSPMQVGYLMRQGCFAGMGCWPGNDMPGVGDLLDRIEPAQDNGYIRQLLMRYAASHPAEVIAL